MTTAVRFTRYHEDWPARFAMAAHELSAVLGTAYSIEHIGSTAVPGLAAKDCIDLLVVAPAREPLEVATQAISDAGYDFRPNSFSEESDHRFFRRVHGGVRTHHLHLLIAGHPEIVAYLALRDLLRHDESARGAYERLKVGLAEAYPDDRASYIAGKAAFVADLTERAIASQAPGAGAVGDPTQPAGQRGQHN